MKDLDFVHKFFPGASGNDVVLLLLHGTGGDENDLIPLGRALMPDAALLSLRGKVLENGMPRFFRRVAEGVFDIEDLKFRTRELSDFLNAAREEYGLSKARFMAVGYSNGANIAVSLMLLYPAQLSAAVLFRAMVPFEPDARTSLANVSVFMGAGQRDPIARKEITLELKKILERGGAAVTLHWHNGGHELGDDDLVAAQQWIRGRAV